MSAWRRLPTRGAPPRAAFVLLAHRRDARGVPWARAPLGDGDALDTALGSAVTAGLSPVLAVVGQGDPTPALADHVVEVEPTADVTTALAAAHAALPTEPVHVLVAPVEQPLSSGTLLWTLVAACEAHAEGAVAAAHEGQAGHPWALRRSLLGAAPRAPAALVEAGAVARFWSADAPGADDEAIGARARALLATAVVRRSRLGEGGAAAPERDHLAVEEPLEVRLAGEPLVVIMRTPGHDRELATGFLLTEGVVRAAGELRALEVRGNHVLADVAPEAAARATARRAFYASSSCGVCGKASIDEVVLEFPRLAPGPSIPWALLSALPERLTAAQDAFARTGGLHAAGLFDEGGTLMVLREDVGRHNAVDKVVGWAAARGALPLRSCVLVVSGRIGFEIAQKATAAGLPIVVAVGAPSSLAVELAARGGLTLVGFVRGGRGNVYTHPERVAP